MGRTSWVTRTVVGIVLATFFSDVGHEMVTAVLPLYLGSIGLGTAALGVMEGAADLAFSLSKLAGGAVGHRSRRRWRRPSSRSCSPASSAAWVSASSPVPMRSVTSARASRSDSCLPATTTRSRSSCPRWSAHSAWSGC